MMANAAVKLEREKRKTELQRELFDILKRPEVLAPVAGIGGAMVIQQLGKHRIINRDWAGFCLAGWVAMSAAKAGITDRWALGAITAAATAGYALTTPPTEEEAIVTIEPGKLLGGDGKLFWWDIPFVGAEV